MRRPSAARYRSRSAPLHNAALAGRRIGIAGPGLIGASIGLRASELGARVTGWDADGGNLRDALERGAIGASAASFADLVAASEVLVLATPLDVTIALLGTLARMPASAGLVVDVASIKAPVALAGAGVPNFAGTHPIAGSERSGSAAARADLFDGKTWAFDAAVPAPLAAQVRALIVAMGGVPLPIDAADHDRIVAATSHLPQMLSVLLGAHLAVRLEDATVRVLSGSGLASMLRLAGSSWAVWQPVLRDNAVPVAHELREVAHALLAAAASLESGAADGLEPSFADAGAAYARVLAIANGVRDVDVE